MILGQISNISFLRLILNQSFSKINLLKNLFVCNLYILDKKYFLQSDGLPVLDHNLLQGQQGLLSNIFIFTLFGFIHYYFLNLQRINDVPAMGVEPAKLP